MSLDSAMNTPFSSRAGTCEDWRCLADYPAMSFISEILWAITRRCPTRHGKAPDVLGSLSGNGRSAVQLYPNPLQHIRDQPGKSSFSPKSVQDIDVSKFYVVADITSIPFIEKPKIIGPQQLHWNAAKLTSQISATSFARRAGGEKTKVYNLTTMSSKIGLLSSNNLSKVSYRNWC